jgi:hypothetical protein
MLRRSTEQLVLKVAYTQATDNLKYKEGNKNIKTLTCFTRNETLESDPIVGAKVVSGPEVGPAEVKVKR